MLGSLESTLLSLSKNPSPAAKKFVLASYQLVFRSLKEQFEFDDKQFALLHLSYARSLAQMKCYVEAEQEYNSYLSLISLYQEKSIAYVQISPEFCQVLKALGKEDRIAAVKKIAISSLKSRQPFNFCGFSQLRSKEADKSIGQLREEYARARDSAPYAAETLQLLRQLDSLANEIDGRGTDLQYYIEIFKIELRADLLTPQEVKRKIFYLFRAFLHNGDKENALVWLRKLDQYAVSLSEPAERLEFFEAKQKSGDNSLKGSTFDNTVAYLNRIEANECTASDINAMSVLARICLLYTSPSPRD